MDSKHQYINKYLDIANNVLNLSDNSEFKEYIDNKYPNIKLFDIDSKDSGINYDIIYCNIIDFDTDLNPELLLAKFIIINCTNNNCTNSDNIKKFMEINDEFVYDNDDFTYENKLIIIRKKEENEKNIICIIKENAQFPNPKSFELFTYYFNNKYKIVNKNAYNICSFIEEKNKYNNVLVFIHDVYLCKFDLITLNHIQNNSNIKCKIYVLPLDWWNMTHKSIKYFNQVTTNVFKANNYKVIVNVPDVKILSEFNGTDYFHFQDNIICYAYWGIYRNGIMPINNEPIKKLFISGSINDRHYPERYFISNLKNENVYVYEYNHSDGDNNNYSVQLNKYLCCFSSSVHLRCRTQKQRTNSHTVLLKTFEILGAGSLLVVPNSEEPYLKKYGLINNEHYMTINFNFSYKHMRNEINNLFEESNLPNINRIRLNGYNYAINNLTNKNKFDELNNIFMSNV